MWLVTEISEKYQMLPSEVIKLKSDSYLDYSLMAAKIIADIEWSNGDDKAGSVSDEESFMKQIQLS